MDSVCINTDIWIRFKIRWSGNSLVLKTSFNSLWLLNHHYYSYIWSFTCLQGRHLTLRTAIYNSPQDISFTLTVLDTVCVKTSKSNTLDREYYSELQIYFYNCLLFFIFLKILLWKILKIQTRILSLTIYNTCLDR